MKHFIELIQIARAQNIEYPEFWKSVEAAHSFVCTKTDDNSYGHAIEGEEGEELDLPFPIIAFEAQSTKPDHIVTLATLSPHNDPQSARDVLRHIFCFLCVEKAPRVYDFYLFTTGDDLRFPRINVINREDRQYPALCRIVKDFLGRLAKESVGVEKVNQTVRIGCGAERRLHKIKQVVHVRPKKDQGLNLGTRPINWSHRFEVRGHWREHKGLGKDRAGIYCVEGFTWVTHHTRGPEHLPLIKKIRMIETTENNERNKKENGDTTIFNSDSNARRRYPPPPNG